MEITITLTYQQAKAMRHTLLQCLSLAERSPTIANALGVTPEMRKSAASAVNRIQLPHSSHETDRNHK